ncbi:hypothetical protein T439DRAFT_348160 [Meredithblackwellia eburnea MCA 4105]
MLRLLRPSRAVSSASKTTASVRPLSTLGSAPSHSSNCTCARCSSRPISYPTTIPRPIRARPLSTIAGGPTHPSSCTCAKCSSSPISFPTTTPRPRPGLGLSGNAKAVVEGVRGMKVRSSVKKYCDHCSIVKRGGTVFVICPKDPKHKQRQG